MSEKRIILNITGGGSVAATAKSASATVAMERLNRLMLKLKSDFIDETAGVNYGDMKKSQTFEEYIALAAELASVEIQPLGAAERKAFFINLYNAMTVHVLAKEDKVPSGPLKMEGMWTSYSYCVGGHVLNLDEIEHGILRANSGHPKTPEKPIFPEGDPKRALSLKTLDPRIHFGLNCGARSCPPIRVYTASNLDAQLDKAAASFCSQEVKLTPTGDAVELSKLMLWYSKDFGKTEAEVLRSVAGFLRDGDVVKETVLKRADELKIEFREYDWNTFAKI